MPWKVRLRCLPTMTSTLVLHSQGRCSPICLPSTSLHLTVEQRSFCFFVLYMLQLNECLRFCGNWITGRHMQIKSNGTTLTPSQTEEPLALFLSNDNSTSVNRSSSKHKPTRGPAFLFSSFPVSRSHPPNVAEQNRCASQHVIAFWFTGLLSPISCSISASSIANPTQRISSSCVMCQLSKEH